MLRSFYPAPRRLAHPFERGPDEPFGAPLAPRLLGDFDPLRSRHGPEHDDLVALERSPTLALRIIFPGMGAYDSLSVDFDVGTNVLSVTGSNQRDKHSAGARRAISMPCVVTKPMKITAEMDRGSCVVTVPADAQGPLPEPTPKRKREPKALRVTIHDSTDESMEEQPEKKPGSSAGDEGGVRSLDDALKEMTSD